MNMCRLLYITHSLGYLTQNVMVEEVLCECNHEICMSGQKVEKVQKKVLFQKNSKL